MSSTIDSLRWTTLTDADTPAWSALHTALAEADGHEELYEPEDLVEELASENLDAAAHTWAVYDGDLMVGFAAIRARTTPRYDGNASAFIGGGVHPDHRGRGIGTALLDRAEPAAHDLVAQRQPGVDYVIGASGGREGSSAAALLAERGFVEARWWLDMVRPLPGDAVEAPVPDGVRVVGYTDDLSEQLRDAHNDSFRTHWGSGPVEPGPWQEYVTSRSARHEFTRVALDPSGRILGFATAAQWTPRELYVNTVGTRQEAQGRGIGRAVLGALLRDAAASGQFDRVGLDVDSANPSNAGALYTKLGFEPVRALATYQQTHRAR